MMSGLNLKIDMNQLAKLEKEITGEEVLVLYHFPYCPFCVLVRNQLETLGLMIETRDIRQNRAFAKELHDGGGRYTVPCLRIEGTDGRIDWLYESRDILRYLECYVATGSSLA